MDLLANLALGASVALSGENLLYCLIGSLLGTLIGVLPGVLLGVGVASVINLSTMIVTGHAVRFQWYPEFMLVAVVAEILLVILAALFPAERAARLNLAKALQYE